MSDIVVFGGTLEGRQIAEALSGADINLHICVATEYGASLLKENSNLQVYAGRMDAGQMRNFLEEIKPDYCLDATHPYAKEATENIKKACEDGGFPYIRVLRKEEETTGDVIYKKSVEEAAAFLQETTGNILITTGSRDLEKYTVITDYKTRCFARVLPTLPVMEKCKELGFEGRNLIGMQGPFGKELNLAMLRQVDASWMVTKSSGKEGGFLEKCRAAQEAGVSVIVIGRPEEEKCHGMELSQVLAFFRERYLIQKKRKLYFVGMGPGKRELLTGEAENCLKQCDVLIGAKRMLDGCGQAEKKPTFQSYQKEEIVTFLREHPEYEQAALLYSGDIGFYSGAKGMKELLPEYEVHPLCGIASPVYFMDRLNLPWEETCFVSCHGANPQMIPMIRREKKVVTLLGKEDTIARISRQLLEFGMEDIRITVGERLSYPTEQITSGYPKDFLSGSFDSLAVALFENPDPEIKRAGFGIRDLAFIRDKIPMTKEEIRILSLAKLGLKEDSILYDIGAGTGSVSIEAALQCDRGIVYAIEKNTEAIPLLEANRVRFRTENLKIVEGEAPFCLEQLPMPSHAFIGGSGGHILEIIRAVRKKNPKVRFVVNAVTLETISQIEKIKESFPEYEDMEVVNIQVSKNRALGRYQMMRAENPVYILAFGGEKEENDGT